MTRHLFCAINNLFRPNNKDDIVWEEPISFKKLCKGYAVWNMHKVVLKWSINTAKQVLTLPDDFNSNLFSLIDTIPPSASRCSRRSWHKLLGNLRITVPDIAGAAGIFTRLHHAQNSMRPQDKPVHTGPCGTALLAPYGRIDSDLTNAPKRNQTAHPHMDRCNRRFPHRHGRSLIQPIRGVAHMAANIQHRHTSPHPHRKEPQRMFDHQ